MNNISYQCVRSIDTAQSETNGSIYCEFKCYGEGHVEVPCDADTVQGQGEYYDLDKDYFELDNIWTSLDKNGVDAFKQRIAALMNCSGQTSCNELRLVDDGERSFYFEYIRDKLV